MYCNILNHMQFIIMYSMVVALYENKMKLSLWAIAIARVVKVFEQLHVVLTLFIRSMQWNLNNA